MSDSSQSELVELFGERTGHEIDTFSVAAWTASPEGVPVLDTVDDVMVVRRTAVWNDGAGYICLIGVPVNT